MSQSRDQRLKRFQSRRLETMRLQAFRSVAWLMKGEERYVRTMRPLLDWLICIIDQDGCTWLGAVAMAREMGMSERWVRELLDRACEERWIQQIYKGGGTRNTSVYRLLFGPWKFEQNRPHAQAEFAATTKRVLYAHWFWVRESLLTHPSRRHAPAAAGP